MRQASWHTRRALLLCAAFLSGQLALVAQETYRPLAPGLEYRHEVRANGPLSIHSLRIDRTGNRWDLRTALGRGTIYGLEPLDGIVGTRTGSLPTRLTPVTFAISGVIFAFTAATYAEATARFPEAGGSASFLSQYSWSSPSSCGARNRKYR